MIVMSFWYNYNGVQSIRETRELKRNIQTLLALSGISSKNGENQGLNQLISRNLKPREIIPTQEEELAKAFSVIRSAIPSHIWITYLGPADWTSVALPIQLALQRNGISTDFREQITLSPDDTGLMFTMPDPSNPPDYALALRDAFGLAGIRNIRFIRMAPSFTSLGFTIFVGPPSLN